VDNCQNE